MDTRPYYRRTLPSPQDPQSFNQGWIDFSQHHLPPFRQPDQSGAVPDSRPDADSLFDSRAAAIVKAAVGDPKAVTLEPQGSDLEFNALLERKPYGDAAPTILIPTPKCMAAMAYGDYFPDDPNVDTLRCQVSAAIMSASPGWCGTFGPDVDSQGSSKGNFQGNYDMTQMWLLPLAYTYYDLLTPEAREKLITVLLANGRIHRASLDDTFTSGGAPNDWDRAGRVDVVDVKVANIPETENHVLMIATARYLTNQLLYPRTLGKTLPLGGPLWLQYDNRRNGNPDDSRPTCMDQVLFLLRNKLRDDFAEYNAKDYQEESRTALLNLFSYAYDAEVRLAAGMVLDYVAAHIAISSCDLRRMVPFRRRDEGPRQRQDPDHPGFMDVSLLPGHGGDPMADHLALHAGNTRVYQLPDLRVWPGDSGPARPWFWGIENTNAPQLFLEALSDYRLAPSVHDLFVNDLHRRFYQRLHRYVLTEPGDQRNCNNLEIYSGSPSYLISAGGQPAPWVIEGGFKPSFPNVTDSEPVGWQQQNLGVAMPISFMPVSLSAGADVSTSDSRQVVQMLHFSDLPQGFADVTGTDHGGTENYGVAPDFACGIFANFPAWTGVPASGGGVFFVDKHARTDRLTLRSVFQLAGIPLQTGVRNLAEEYGLTGPFSVRALIDPVSGFGSAEPAGFYLAIHRQGDFCVLEAFDTWRHPEVSFQAFQARVKSNNPNVTFASGQEAVYTTYFGNKIHYVIWQNLELDNHTVGSKILQIEFGAGDPSDTLVGAGNDSGPFLTGTILRSQGDGKVEIHNPSLSTTLTLDYGDPDPHRVVRTAENGEVQQTGAGFDVWIDFDWKPGGFMGASEGDFYRPFNTVESALNAVIDGGVIHLMTGSIHDRLTIHKRVTLRPAAGPVAPGPNCG